LAQLELFRLDVIIGEKDGKNEREITKEINGKRE